MTEEIQQSPVAEPKSAPFGTRLKSAREALGLDYKDAAAQLRLNEKFILMMEKDRYPTDLPATFIRGYIRAYAKLLQIPEHEVRKAIEPIQPKPTQVAPPLIQSSVSVPSVVTASNYFVQLFSYLILFTLIGLAGIWWYSHNNANSESVKEEATINPAPNNAATTPIATPSMPVSEPAITPAASPNNTAQSVSTPGKVPPSNSPSANPNSRSNAATTKTAPADDNADSSSSTDNAADDNTDNNVQSNDNNAD